MITKAIIFSTLFVLSFTRLFIDYSASQQAVLIEHYFYGIQNKTYLDIGAFDPVNLSNTNHLQMKGWTGFNIQANPQRFIKFVSERPFDVNINIAMGNKEEFIKLNELSEQTNSEVTKSFENERGIQTKQSVAINSVRLSTFCQRFFSKEGIDLMLINAQGISVNVLSANNWSSQKCKPKAILAKYNDNNQKQQINTIMEKAGYTLKETKNQRVFYVVNNLIRQFDERNSLAKSIIQRYQITVYKDLLRDLSRYFDNPSNSQTENNQIQTVFHRNHHILDYQSIIDKYATTNSTKIILLEFNPRNSNVLIKSGSYNIQTLVLQTGQQLFQVQSFIQGKTYSIYILNQYQLKKEDIKITKFIASTPIQQEKIQTQSELLSQINLIQNAILLIVFIATIAILWKNFASSKPTPQFLRSEEEENLQ